jgi:uncharacterized protein
MAIELSKKLVKDQDEYNDYALGITLPIQISNVAFAQSYNSIDQIKSNIQNLLLTKKGERILQPEFGCDLHSIVFNNITSDFETDVENAIESAFEFWMPFVKVDEILIDTNADDVDRNRVNISLTFSVDSYIESQTITFNMEE